MKNLHIISLGCARNLVDSEIILGSMQAKGYNISDEAKNSEVIVVNTCGFIDQAKQESVDTILEAAQFKEKGSCEKLVVVGCLSERYSEELQESIPEIDLIMGSSSFPHVADEVEKLYLANSSSEAEDKIVIHQERLKDFDLPRVNSLGKQSAYLKVAEGCAKRCSFCVIPQLRGKLRSRSIASLSKEAMSLVGQGVRELNLIAQDLTDYGLDRQDGASLAKLIDSLTAISDLRWLRLFYAYPDQLNDEVIDRIASQEKICRYLDIPVQHISNKILKSMNRRTCAEDIYRMIERVRERVPGIFIRTSLMVGFPGETEEDFQMLEDFVKRGWIDHLGVFSYSHEEGAPSYRLQDDVTPEEKEERKKRLYEIQLEFSKNRLDELLGQEVEVLVEGLHPESEHLYIGRHEGQAPDIDNHVIINEGHVTPGKFHRVKITETAGLDLVGSVVS